MSVFATLGRDGFYQLTQAGYLLIIAVMIGAMLLVCLIRRPDEKGTLGTRKLVFSAMAIALATVASMIKFFHLPMGGSQAIDLLTGETVSIENSHLSLTLDSCESKILKIVG